MRIELKANKDKWNRTSMLIWRTSVVRAKWTPQPLLTHAKTTNDEKSLQNNDTRTPSTILTSFPPKRRKICVIGNSRFGRLTLWGHQVRYKLRECYSVSFFFSYQKKKKGYLYHWDSKMLFSPLFCYSHSRSRTRTFQFTQVWCAEIYIYILFGWKIFLLWENI